MRHALAVVVVGLTAAACADSRAGSDWTSTVDTPPNDAVQVVNMPSSSGESALWRLEEQLRIGSVDEGGPTTFGELKALVVDSAGRIMMLESQAQEIRRFDRNGRHLATFGGEGGGPGEFENAFGHMQTSDGLLYVPDQRFVERVGADSPG